MPLDALDFAARLLSASVRPREYVSERSMGTPEEKAKVRADFEPKYGKPAAEAMDRHEAELTKLQEETLKAALGPAKK